MKAEKKATSADNLLRIKLCLTVLRFCQNGVHVFAPHGDGRCSGQELA